MVAIATPETKTSLCQDSIGYTIITGFGKGAVKHKDGAILNSYLQTQAMISLTGLIRRRPFVPTCLAILFAVCLSSMLFWTYMPKKTYTGPFLPLSASELAVKKQLFDHVLHLAGTIGERNIWRPGSMAAAARYIEASLGQKGCTLSHQTYTTHGAEAVNLICEIPGTGRPEEIIVIGAHYDTVINTPGADDNASGVAGLLALASLLSEEQPHKTIRLVAFANEEPPFYFTEDMGSRHYAKLVKSKGESISAMLSLEMLGAYSDEPNSQSYPFPLQFFYPDTANFIAFVGNLQSRPLIRKTVALFRRTTPFPAEGLAAPAAIPGVSWSDHWSFWQEGFTAIMVTDTSFYRYPRYHSPGDIPEKLDYNRMARVIVGLSRVVLALAQQGE